MRKFKKQKKKCNNIHREYFLLYCECNNIRNRIPHIYMGNIDRGSGYLYNEYQCIHCKTQRRFSGGLLSTYSPYDLRTKGHAI